MKHLLQMGQPELVELKSNVESELFKRDLAEIRDLERQANQIRARAGLRKRMPLKKERSLK